MSFLDTAATTPCDAELARRLAERLTEPANPLSVHQQGQRARARLDVARDRMADLLGVESSEVVFTASATESNNLCLRGLAARQPLRIVRSELEHSRVRETSAALERSGHATVELLRVDQDGRAILPNSLPESHPESLKVLCLMSVQNETGVTQPLAEARAFALRAGALWLCDATQAFGLAPFRRPELGWDFLSLSSHKVYGPPGVGVLAGPGVARIAPMLTGGPQEQDRRAGTQPVALIEAFVDAAIIAAETAGSRRAHLAALETAFLETLGAESVPYRRNGNPAFTVPGFLNISVTGLESVDLVIGLDALGFAISSGPACATGVMELSPALTAMFPDDAARVAGAVRITPGRETQPDEMIRCARAIARIHRRSSAGVGG
jgi:cysteine desulfurase